MDSEFTAVEVQPFPSTEKANYDDPSNADRSLSRLRCYICLSLLSFAAMLTPFSATIYLPALISIQKSLDTTSVLTNATVSSYVFCMGFFPLFWGPFSDNFGRRPVILVAMLIYTIMSLVCAFSTNIWMLLVARGLQACGSSAANVVGAGSIGDMFPVESRGTAMGLFFLGVLVGPLIGPIVGGFIDQQLGWRAMFFILSGLGFTIWICILLFLPETLVKKDTKLKLKDILMLPVAPLLMLRHLSVVLVNIQGGVMYSCLYMLISVVPRVYDKYYALDSATIGLTFLPYALGTICGSLTGGRLTDLVLRAVRARIRSGQGPDAKVSSEHRLWIGMIGDITAPVGVLLFGWLAYNKVSIWLTFPGLFIMGFSALICFTAVTTFLVDAFSENSASVIASNYVTGSTFTAIMTALAVPMLDALGLGWFVTVLAAMVFVSILAPAIVLFRHMSLYF